MVSSSRLAVASTPGQLARPLVAIKHWLAWNVSRWMKHPAAKHEAFGGTRGLGIMLATSIV
jgi:hypothetical protein